MNARVLSSAPLSKEERHELEGVLSKKFTNLTFDYVVDADIIGGLRIEVGDWVYDATIARELGQMVTVLKN